MNGNIALEATISGLEHVVRNMCFNVVQQTPDPLNSARGWRDTSIEAFTLHAHSTTADADYASELQAAAIAYLEEFFSRLEDDIRMLEDG